MRDELCAALVRRSERPNMVFLTGDLGFAALEPLREALGDRFINAGVAEQNMVTVAAAMAAEGFEVWVYSIAPFCYARPFEQIRNDVCMHRLPVRLLGNGGGYGYGVMGPTHHALEDYGILLTLAGMEVYVPCFNEDVEQVVERAGASTVPCYVRLGRGEEPKDATIPAYAPWRKLLDGKGPVVVAVGPLAGAAMSALQGADVRLWALSELPVAARAPSPALVADIEASGAVCVYEEHVAHGGVASMLGLWLLLTGMPVRRFRALSAAESASGRSGSQVYLRQMGGLGPDALLAAIKEAAHDDR
jgi:transketolase